MKEEEILKEINSYGYKFNSIYDIICLKKIPIDVIKYCTFIIEEGYQFDTNIRECLYRILTDKGAKGIANEALFNDFHKIKDDNLKWLIENAFTKIIREEDIDEITDLLNSDSDSHSRFSRQMFIISLKNIHTEKTEHFIKNFFCENIDNLEFLSFIIEVLIKYKLSEMKEDIIELKKLNDIRLNKAIKKATKMM